MAKFTILDEKEISQELEKLSDWKVVGGKIKASYIFKDFRTAFAFITLISIEAEVRDHHPEWSNAYNRVEFAFCTHDAGNKITDLDIAMAHYITQTSKKFLENK